MRFDAAIARTKSVRVAAVGWGEGRRRRKNIERKYNFGNEDKMDKRNSNSFEQREI
jgi:hypothetical protein